MATDWNLQLGCNSNAAGNSFAQSDSNNLWQNRTTGNTTWNNAGNGKPKAAIGDSVYVTVTDQGGSASGMAGFLVASKDKDHKNQAETTPFLMNGSTAGRKSTVIPQTVTGSTTNGVTTWAFGPYSCQQNGKFELTFAANLTTTTGSELSDSWEEDPEFDVGGE